MRSLPPPTWKFVVVLHIPLCIETHCLECVVKCDAVTISFGIDDHTVLVKKDCFNCHIILLCLSGAAKQVDPTPNGNTNGIADRDINFAWVILIGISRDVVSGCVDQGVFQFR